MKRLRVILYAFIFSMGIAETSFAGQWVNDNGWRYQQDDGNYMKNDWYKGNDGNDYYLNGDGLLCTGWYQIDSKWYYAEKNGATVKDKWIEYEGDYYCIQSDGTMAAGTTIDGCRIGSDGKKVSETINYEIKNYTEVTSSIKRSVDTIPPGEYLMYASQDTAHVKVINGSECIVDNYNFLELLEGDTVEVNGVYVPVSGVGELDITLPGMFRVGTDIAEGTYSVCPPPEDDKHVNIAICTVFNTIPSSKDREKPEQNVVSKQYIFSGDKQVTVKNGQYLQLINCTANLRRP